MNSIKQTIPIPLKYWLKKMLLQQKFKRSTPIIVYQMGKVGSSSIYHSLQMQCTGCVFHAHEFHPDIKNLDIRYLYEWASDGNPLSIISLVREPVGRNVSAFFQNFERDTGVPYSKSKFSIEELKALFLSKYNHNIPLNWFDDNIRSNFGIDVFSEPFPKCGFSTFQKDNVRLLVIKSETDDEKKSEAIRDFLGMDNFHIRNANIGSKKDYADTYNLFKRTVKFNLNHLDEAINSKYFKHFYDADMADILVKRWSDRASHD